MLTDAIQNNKDEAARATVGDAVLGATREFAEEHRLAAQRLRSLAQEGTLQEHQTAGQLDEIADSLIKALRGEGAADAD